MEVPVELIPLNCIRCGTSLPAEIEEVAWVCEQCEQGQQLGVDGLAPLKIHYSQGITPPKKGRPFWVAEGRVTVQRDTYGRAKSEQEAQQFWVQPHQFFIPAYPVPLDEIYRLGIGWLRQPPAMQPGPVTAFEPVIVAAEDVPVWAEFLVVALEAERKDKVKTVDFQLEMAEPQLWVLP